MDDAWLLNSMTVEQLKVTCSSLQRSHGDMQVLLQEFQVEQVLLRREQDRMCRWRVKRCLGSASGVPGRPMPGAYTS